ncbi:MAG: alpha/beta hydrolase family protein, partial [Chromatiales bacterium]|nr:alpha/beta hydrolase family protein [Chromatiales bacterium]
VIILHGRGAHPDWSDVINPLRSELPAHGWQTLSIQLPVAEAGAKDLVYQGLIPEALPRIAAAIDYFDQQGVQNVAIVAHSLGTLMGAAYLAENADSDAIKGFVAISMPLVEGEGAANVPEVLGKLKVPMLDIYGSRDIASVRNTVRQRAIAIRKGEGNAYRSLEIEGADHFFIGLESVLVGRVNGWLRTVITTVD